jgi:hypothetical protein
MAQKKITDLQLIAALVDSANFIVDTGIQSYRSTATQLMTYIYSKLNALGSVDPLAADFVLGFDASDSNAAKRFAVSRFKNATYRAVVTTDSIGADDETMVLSGASFTSTLPTAVGVAGKRYKFLHAGTSLSQVYTLATTSSQTIGGVAGGSYALYTAGECLEIESDGANWIILGRISRTPWSVYVPTYTAFGTVSTTNMKWRRDGDELQVQGRFVAGTPTGSEARVSLPGSITSHSSITTLEYYGSGIRSSAGATDVKPFNILVEPSTAYFVFSISPANAAVGSFSKANGNGLVAAAETLSLKMAVPITGWQP